MSENLRGQPWVRTLQDLLAALPGVVSDRLELLTLELQRAGRRMLQILALVLATAMLGATGWLALCSGLGLLLVEQGLGWPLALLVVLLLNLVLAWAAVSRMRRLVGTLGLPATRRHLLFGAGAADEADRGLQRQPFTATSPSATEARP